MPIKLGAFAAALAVLFGGGALAGGAVGPDREEPRAAREAADAGHGHAPAAASAATHVEVPGGHGAGAAAHPVRGLAVAQDGLRVVVADPELRAGRAEVLRFRVVDEAGETVRDFDVEHERRMHLIVARRDLSGFQHLHPEQGADGAWRVRLRLDEPGSYRLFADFATAGKPYTLATDLRVDGAADLRPLPAPATIATSDAGSQVRLDAGSARPGREAQLRFTVTRDGRTVHTEPYLGAGGHLVALREGDLAFLHVHPTEHGHGDDADPAAGHDDSIGFAATFPTAGRYRLFLQVKVDGRVETVAFTQEVR